MASHENRPKEFEMPLSFQIVGNTVMFHRIASIGEFVLIEEPFIGFFLSNKFRIVSFGGGLLTRKEGEWV